MSITYHVSEQQGNGVSSFELLAIAQEKQPDSQTEAEYISNWEVKTN